MILRIYENEQEDLIIEANEEGIDWLIAGLEQCRELEPGDSATTPSLVTDDDGPRGVGNVELKRAADEEEE